MPQRRHAGLAQLVEHLICNQGVTSSNLVAGTIFLRAHLKRRSDRWLLQRLRFATAPNQRVLILSGCGKEKARARRAFSLAETEGFEPSVPNYQYDGLANRWFQPLTHVSIPMAAGGRIARGKGGCNANSARGESSRLTRTAPVLTRVTARSLCRLHDRF